MLMFRFSHGMMPILILSLTFFLAPPPPSSTHDETREWTRPSYSVHPLRFDSPHDASSYWFNWSADIPTTVHTRLRYLRANI